ncbi:hypothetical protein TSUD_122720 [Trifolium subterraneum]|uniref:Transmembrane protein n=1 Tax=Trifolium subterraneum TaxID=3900 RepID=A0A2Z6P7C3_TRISU|nr:hypothetical protein TSUD_122720 [Trifolium subterraneum]
MKFMVIIIISLMTLTLLLAAAGREAPSTELHGRGVVAGSEKEVPSPPFPIPLIDPPPSWPIAKKDNSKKKKIAFISLGVAILLIIGCVMGLLVRSCC